MRFSLKKKLKKVGAVALACSMVVGMMTSLPGGLFSSKAKAEISGGTVKTWNFRGGQEGAYEQKLQGTTGEFDGLTIDATSGKCFSRFDKDGKFDTQINAGTKFTVPVPAESDWTLEIISRDTNVWKVGSTEAVKSEETVEDGWGYVYTITGSTDESTTSIELLLAETGNSYTREIKLTARAITYKEPEAPTVPGNGKIDVADFGAEALDADKYNNILTADVINGFYPEGTEAGKSGVNIADFSFKDAEGNAFVTFNAGGKTNHRLRTSNEKLTRYDGKTLTTADESMKFSGYIYSNASSTDTVNLKINATANDKLTLYLGSNSGTATYNMVSPSGVVTELKFTDVGKAQEYVYYAPETGEYTLWCTNEKLVCARIVREHSTPVKVTGTSTYSDPASLGTAAPKNYKLAFTCVETGAVTEVDLKSDGSYTAYLYNGFNYNVSLLNANGYVVASDTKFKVEGVNGAASYDCAVNPVDLCTISGTLTNLSDVAIKMAKFTFKSNNIFVPELTVNADGTYTLTVEKGVEYAVSVVDVNDFELKTTTIKADANTSDYKIEFVAKPVYDVTITLEGVDAEVAAGATYLFTNINETYSDEDATPYTYTFKATDKIQLRDGQYQVKVMGLNKLPLSQMYTKDVKVNGAAGSTTVKFKTMNEWDFGTVWETAGDIQKDETNGYVLGLKTSLTQVMKNKTYLLMNNGGSFEVPVKKGDVVTFTYCYQAAFKVGDTVVGANSGSTTKFDSTSIVAAEDGVMLVEGVEVADVPDKNGNPSTAKQTYFTKITVSSKSAYQAVVKVGANKQFTNINDALAFIRKMDRPNGEKVTVEIDPGTYDEMLVIDTPNVTLKNASKTPSIELENKGVDANANAVRITSYYGHGYTYYSMGPDCKYDAWLLEVNQYNGYPLFKNPGTGTTSGSYWNATVVVYADGFNADGIIFENAFNQYVSELAAADTIVPQGTAAKGEELGARNNMKAGDTSVQNKKYVERAAALAIANDVNKSYFNNCKFVGRQDTLYGGVRSTVAFNKCSVYGGTDYIFGGMTAVFNECDLVFNTMEDNNDVGHITAAQTGADTKGMLMYNCNVKSTFPGVDTASTSLSKPGTFGRPWAAGTGMAVFVNTKIDATVDAEGKLVSLIQPAGWNSGLAGESANSMEYNSTEVAGVDNSSKRVTWATTLTEEKLPDGTDISIHTWLGDWDPFNAEGESEVKPVSPDASVSEDATGKIEFTDAEKAEIEAGAKVEVILETTDISDSISAEEKALIEAKLTGKLEGAKIGMFLDLDLFKVVGGNKTAVETTTAPVKVTVALPANLITTEYQRTYKVVRVHNGVADVLDATFDASNNTITFETDKFSTYAVIYMDGEAVNSGDVTPVAMFAGLALLSVIALAAVVLFDKKRKFVR